MKEAAQRLLDAFDKRVQADYGVEAIVTAADAAPTIEQAREFVEQARRYLEAPE